MNLFDIHQTSFTLWHITVFSLMREHILFLACLVREQAFTGFWLERKHTTSQAPCDFSPPSFARHFISLQIILYKIKAFLLWYHWYVHIWCFDNVNITLIFQPCKSIILFHLGTSPCAQRLGQTGRANCLMESQYWSSTWDISLKTTSWAGH